jgi:hypothetical protein
LRLPNGSGMKTREVVHCREQGLSGRKCILENNSASLQDDEPQFLFCPMACLLASHIV